MPKSKHGKGRRAQYRNKPRQQTATQPQSAQTAISENDALTATAAKPALPKSTINTRTQSGKTSTAALQLPPIGAELRKIAIVTGIIVVILVVLAFTLR
jgi:hypothetical protein